jgi:DNA-binding transcriptional ArsR family regulator
VPDVYQALSDPTRREILAMLREADMTAGAIADRFAISKPSISHHLAALRSAGLVESTRRGQEIVYSLNTTVFQDVLTFVLGMLDEGEDGRGEDLT